MSRLPGELTYDELCIMIQRVFKQDLISTDKMVFRYADEDSDLVNLESDIDISHALSISNTLKLFIFDTSMTFIPSNLSQCAPEAAYLLQLNTSDSSRDQIKTHLKEIRDQITRLLDRLDDSSEPSRGSTKAVPEAVTASGKTLNKIELDTFLPESSKSRLEIPAASAPPMTPTMTAPNGAVTSQPSSGTYPPQQQTQQHPINPGVPGYSVPSYPPHPQSQQQPPSSVPYHYPPQQLQHQQHAQQQGPIPPPNVGYPPQQQYGAQRPPYPPSSLPPPTGYTPYPGPPQQAPGNTQPQYR